jgi:hypothetical protein
MARTGLSKSQVRASRDQLLAEGRYPSVDAVRLALGNTGSKSTIHKYLKELESEDSSAGVKHEDTARALQTMVEQLAEQLHHDAEQRVRAMRAEHELALQEKDAQLAELRSTIAVLTARLEGRGGHFDISRPADQAEVQPPRRSSIADAGFGHFSGLLSNARGGRPEASPFSIILASERSEAVDINALRPSGLKFQ